MVKLRTPEKQIKPTPENLSITFQCKVKKQTYKNCQQRRAFLISCVYKNQSYFVINTKLHVLQFSFDSTDTIII